MIRLMSESLVTRHHAGSDAKCVKVAD